MLPLLCNIPATSDESPFAVFSFVMEAAIESRLTALEERLGLPPYDGSKPDTVLDVFSLKKKINELGYGFIFKIQPDVLKKCCNIGEEVGLETLLLCEF